MNNNKIKVVKKTEAAVVNVRRAKAASPRVAAREMVATVTDWVSDLKERKSNETRAAIDMLFAANRRPSEL